MKRHEEMLPLVGGRSDVEDDEVDRTPSPPPSPPPPLATLPKQRQPPHRSNVGSLDFERVVNHYSVQATRDRLGLELLPPDEEIEEDSRRRVESMASSSTFRRYGAVGMRKRPAVSNSMRRKIESKDCFGRPKKRVYSTGRTMTRWALSAAVGLLTGLTAIVLVHVTGGFVMWRSRMLDHLAQDPDRSHMEVFAIFLSANFILAVVSCFLCVQLVPEATGSGIPEVKAFLNGVRVKRFSSWPLFWVKMLGTILSVFSGLAVGMEGPLVHIGAIIGASFTKFAGFLSRLLTKPWLRQQRHLRWAIQPLWKWTTTNLAHFAIDAERRDLVSIGASCGFAASFGAPIGGLLFVLDDISSYFAKTMFLRTLVANSIGTFCLAVWHRNLSNFSIINLGTFQEPDDNVILNRFEEVPLYILVGVGGGLLGGLFCSSFEYLNTIFPGRTPGRGRKMYQLSEVALLSLITSVLLYFLPLLAWACKPLQPDDQRLAILQQHELPRQFFCNTGEVNEMATILFGSRDVAIKRILSDPTTFQQRTLWSVGFLFYLLMTLTFGSVLPSGIFTPGVLVGASLGGAAGMLFRDTINPEITPSVFALVGVAAFLAGLQRSTVSLCVILVEGTGQIKALFPSIIAVLVARYVASLIHPLGLYETIMQIKTYPYLDHEEKRSLDIFEVRAVMSTPVETVGGREKTSTLVRLLRRSSHNGFPVVDPKTKRFLGLVRRDQIVALLECGVFEDRDILTGASSPSEASSVASSEPSQPMLSSRSPKPGTILNSPLLSLAYHINDDRFDGLMPGETHSRQPYHRRQQSQEAVVEILEDNDFDDYEWLLNIRDTLATMPDEVSRLTIPSGLSDEDEESESRIPERLSQLGCSNEHWCVRCE